MRLPRKGVLIRLAIYVPLIAFLSWNAIETCQVRRQAADEAAATPRAPSVDERLEQHKRIITLPDGTQQPIYELTPEEAQELLGAPVEVPDDAPAPADERDRPPVERGD
jgi:hypothetical protein